MVPKMKFLHVNWENGMNIGKDHFIQQENAFSERINDSMAIFLNESNFGLIPIDSSAGDQTKIIIKIDNQRFLKTGIFYCRAVTPGGSRIDIVEENFLPELEVDLTKYLEASVKDEEEAYYILLIAEPFSRRVTGELSTEEDPPRFPWVAPDYKIHLMAEKDLLKGGLNPNALFIGKINISGGAPNLVDNYIPPCMTIFSNRELHKFYEDTNAFFGQLELDLLSIIRKIRDKNQDTPLAKSVLLLSDKLLDFVTENFIKLLRELPNRSPLALFDFISVTARVIRNTIDSMASTDREELLNYFTNWSELKQGDFEKLLVYCINFEYRHFDHLFNLEQFSEYNQIITRLFDKLASLSYIGKKKETSIFVKEQTTKRSFLAD